MKIKKFTARTFSEALALVKKELSQDAVILSTVEKKGLRPQVEVTAAVDYEGNEALPNADCQLRNESNKSQSAIRNSPAPGGTSARRECGVQSEIRKPQSALLRDD